MYLIIFHYSSPKSPILLTRETLKEKNDITSMPEIVEKKRRNSETPIWEKLFILKYFSSNNNVFEAKPEWKCNE